MIVKALRMHNFMPYFGDVLIDFPQDSYANTTIFYGENTKGKTSILNAFRWVLYGEAESKGRRLTYADILNLKAANEGQTEVYVEIEFISGSTEFTIRRILDSESGDEKGKVLASRDGQPITPDAAAQSIERIAPHGTRRFFLFDGELLREYEELMEPTTETAKKIKRAIEDVMGFPSLQKTLHLLDGVEKRFRAESKREKSSNRAVEMLKEERDEIAEALSQKQGELDELKRRDAATQKSLTEVTSDISASKDMKEKFDELTAHQRDRDFLETKILEQEEALKERKSSIWKSLLANQVKEKADAAQVNQNRREKLARDAQRLEILIENLRESLGTGICATCGQETPQKSDSEEQISEKEAELEKLNVDLAEIPTSRSIMDASIRLNRAPRLQDFLEAEQQLDGSITAKAEKVERIDSLRKDIGDFDGEGVDQKIRVQVKLQEAKENLEQAISEIESEISRLKSKSLSLSNQISENSDKSVVSKEASFLCSQRLSDIFEKAKAILREDIKVHVEKAAQEAFLEMTSRPDDYNGLRITDSYGLEMIAADGTVVPQRSAGAEQVVALALIDGLNKVGKSPGPVIMDTPFGRLDETHRSNILKYMPKTARQFMVFVHSGELSKGSKALEPITAHIGREYTIKSSGPYVSYLEIQE